MSDFDGLPGEIGEALAEAGLNASLFHLSTGTGMRYNTQTGTARPSKTRNALAAPVTSCKRALTEKAGLKAGDIKISAPATAFVIPPKEDDEIEDGGRLYRVVAVLIARLGDVVVAYTLQARRP